MDIGEQERVIIVEPLEFPRPEEIPVEPSPERESEPVEEPATEPMEEPVEPAR